MIRGSWEKKKKRKKKKNNNNNNNSDEISTDPPQDSRSISFRSIHDEISQIYTLHIHIFHSILQSISFRIYIYTYGSRSKTHLRLRVSEWHLQTWMYVFCCSGERPRKGGDRLAKGLNTTIYTKYTHENMIIIPRIDFAAARKSAQGSRRGGVRTVLGYHNFEKSLYKKQYFYIWRTWYHTYWAVKFWASLKHETCGSYIQK